MKIFICIYYYFIITNIHLIFYYILFMVGIFGLYFRIFINGIVFNIININFNIYFLINNNILVSYYCKYV